jgi:hypothetical protein
MCPQGLTPAAVYWAAFTNACDLPTCDVLQQLAVPGVPCL